MEAEKAQVEVALDFLKSRYVSRAYQEAKLPQAVLDYQQAKAKAEAKLALLSTKAIANYNQEKRCDCCGKHHITDEAKEARDAVSATIEHAVFASTVNGYMPDIEDIIEWTSDMAWKYANKAVFEGMSIDEAVKGVLQKQLCQRWQSSFRSK